MSLSSTCASAYFGLTIDIISLARIYNMFLNNCILIITVTISTKKFHVNSVTIEDDTFSLFSNKIVAGSYSIFA